MIGIGIFWALLVEVRGLLVRLEADEAVKACEKRHSNGALHIQDLLEGIVILHWNLPARLKVTKRCVTHSFFPFLAITGKADVWVVLLTVDHHLLIHHLLVGIVGLTARACVVDTAPCAVHDLLDGGLSGSAVHQQRELTRNCISAGFGPARAAVRLIPRHLEDTGEVTPCEGLRKSAIGDVWNEVLPDWALFGWLCPCGTWAADVLAEFAVENWTTGIGVAALGRNHYENGGIDSGAEFFDVEIVVGWVGVPDGAAVVPVPDGCQSVLVDVKLVEPTIDAVGSLLGPDVAETSKNNGFAIVGPSFALEIWKIFNEAILGRVHAGEHALDLVACVWLHLIGTVTPDVNVSLETAIGKFGLEHWLGESISVNFEWNVQTLVWNAPDALETVLFRPNDCRFVRKRGGREEEEHQLAVKSDRKRTMMEM